MRVVCPGCLKSIQTCYCAAVLPISLSFDLVILQHPLERKRTIGTARIAHRCVRNSRLIAGVSFDDHTELNALLDDPTRHCVVLYPGPQSIDLSSPSPEMRPEAWVPPGLRLTIIVVDGTWGCAKKMLRTSPRVRALPQVRFTPRKESEYVIREQPDPICLSTIEAITELIECIDPAANTQNLRTIFRDMVQYQLSFAALNRIRRVAQPSTEIVIPLK